MGPESIEGFYDEAFSVPGLLDEIRRGETEGFDGYVIACFDDTGLDAGPDPRRGAGARDLRGGDARRDPCSAAASRW